MNTSNNMEKQVMEGREYGAHPYQITTQNSFTKRVPVGCASCERIE
jgi:hypothetical protein